MLYQDLQLRGNLSFFVCQRCLLLQLFVSDTFFMILSVLIRSIYKINVGRAISARRCYIPLVKYDTFIVLL